MEEKKFIVPDEERRKIKIAFIGMIICVIAYSIIAAAGNMRNYLSDLLFLMVIIWATPILMFILLKKFRFM